MISEAMPAEDKNIAQKTILLEIKTNTRGIRKSVDNYKNIKYNTSTIIKLICA